MELNMELPRSNIDFSGLRSYVYRLAERLNVVLSSLDSENFVSSAGAVFSVSEKSGADIKELKQSIVRTASLISKVEDKLTTTMEESYVAKSDIGTYTSDAVGTYEVGGRGIEQYFSLIEEVSENISKIEGYVKSGVLDEGVIGIEIGSFGVTGETPFKVRLSDNRLSFFDGDSEVAYLSDSVLYITRAEIKGALALGGYELDLTDGVAWRWNGS